MRAVHWFVTLPLTVVFVIFAISNRQPVEITFWPLPVVVETRLFLVVLLGMVAGFLIGELVAWIGGRRWRRDAREKSRRIEALERELAATQALLNTKSGGSPAQRNDLVKQS
ncbi:MAG: hypothetical protein JWL84_4416 [Rhodospirillales bacterium]|nr:hypothetical protein [Rhodospirillales bacterium]